MTRFSTLLTISLTVTSVLPADEPEDRITEVAQTRGLIAFWDFSLVKDGTWTSYHDDSTVDRDYPVYLRRIGDAKAYKPHEWPYDDNRSKLTFDASGPFGHAVRFDQGYIFAEVPRNQFDKTPLDVSGRRSFTLIAWTKFVGKRHLVAGIWDEGGWNKYGGRRQIALFGGLFGSKSTIAHISATGAASYPQSVVSGSQYARCRAIDGQDFANDEWVAMAMTFDPGRDEVIAYTNGVATATEITDPVAKDVFRPEKPIASNPYHFPWAIFSPRTFVIKFNGYNVESSGAHERWLEIDTVENTVTYRQDSRSAGRFDDQYRVKFRAERAGEPLLDKPLVFDAKDKASVRLSRRVKLGAGDRVIVSLEKRDLARWRAVGLAINYGVREGAPFTFGRALGLGNEPIDHGTQLCIDGVAVFDRVLAPEELKQLSFCGE